MFKFSVLTPYLPLLESAVWVTLKFTFFSTFLGFIGGFILALITISKNKIFAPLARFYISVFRGTPLLVQLMFIFYGLPMIGVLIYFATPQLTGYNISAL